MPSAGYVSLNHILLGPTGCYPGLVSRDPAACTDTGTLHLGPLSSRPASLTRQLDGSTGDGDSLASQLSHSPSTEGLFELPHLNGSTPSHTCAGARIRRRNGASGRAGRAVLEQARCPNGS